MPTQFAYYPQNSEFKWKHDHSVVGALEIVAEPSLNVHAEMTEHVVESCEDEFGKCLRTWNEHHLRHEFAHAWDKIPPRKFFFGLLPDGDATIKHNVPKMNDTWVKSVNETYFAPKGYYLSLFVWHWSNATGKSETVIPMIRFHSHRSHE